ncbi:ABC transporter permease [Chloroflexi bacterium TSY]|nr:ABC transporter permease [Chloroflexi bacterium TSY]
MRVFQYFSVALESIRANKLRAALTMLGIIIGVTSVMLTVGIGRGAAESINQDIASQGVNLLVINPKGFGERSSLTQGDVEILTDSAQYPEIVAVAPEYGSDAQLSYQDTGSQIAITGVTAIHDEVRNIKLEKGRFFTEEEVTQQRNVVILPAQTVHTLFKSEEPIGKTIRIQGQTFEVIGVQKKGGSGFDIGFGEAYVPLPIAQKRLFHAPTYRGLPTVTTVNVQVAQQDQLSATEARIEQALRIRHNLDGTDKNDFTIFNQARLLEFTGRITSTLTLLLGAIGGISLLVGGIGIMHIMLVSVTERTKEIGLRKAIGAHDKDILQQFLIESLVLTAVGGVVGVALSYGIGYAASFFLPATFRILIEARAIGAAIGVTVFSGFVFGLYPAIRATRLDPIEALRYE